MQEVRQAMSAGGGIHVHLMNDCIRIVNETTSEKRTYWLHTATTMTIVSNIHLVDLFDGALASGVVP
jgi:hypothetical protein